jgi:hypothetical protein
VNWTPALESTAATVASTITVLQPQDALLISGALAGFDNLADLTVAEAKAYLANPGQTTLQALQTGILTLQQQVNGALLHAARIVDPNSQALVTAALNGVATIVNSIIALVLEIKGNTVQAEAAKAAPLVRSSEVRKLYDPKLSAAIVAKHYGETIEQAEVQVAWGQQELERAGI